MQKKAFIYDLDNTIYPVHSIGDKLFKSLFDLIIKDGNYQGNIEKIKDDIMRKPFQVVANTYHFSSALTEKGIKHLQELSYTGEIHYFKDYPAIKKLQGDRFLVTTGFYKLQNSKIVGLGIEHDFKEIHIVDPQTSNRTKKDVFADIKRRYGYQNGEMLVIGDDTASEIKAAKDLGIDTVLYDKDNLHPDAAVNYRINNFEELVRLYQYV